MFEHCPTVPLRWRRNRRPPCLVSTRIPLVRTRDQSIFSKFAVRSETVSDTIIKDVFPVESSAPEGGSTTTVTCITMGGRAKSQGGARHGSPRNLSPPEPSAPCLPKNVMPSSHHAAFQHNARTHSGSPSTGITVTMDGGVADTARANTTVLTQAVNRRSWVRGGFLSFLGGVSYRIRILMYCDVSCMYPECIL